METRWLGSLGAIPEAAYHTNAFQKLFRWLKYLHEVKNILFDKEWEKIMPKSHLNNLKILFKTQKKNVKYLKYLYKKEIQVKRINDFSVSSWKRLNI